MMYGQYTQEICHLTKKEMHMNWDRIEGNWKQFKGSIQQQWGKLTNDQLDVILGKREKISGQIQVICGIARKAQKLAVNWQPRRNNIPLG